MRRQRDCLLPAFVRRCKNETSWDFICYCPRIRRMEYFQSGTERPERGDPAHDSGVPCDEYLQLPPEAERERGGRECTA